jgi:OmpA-OmpF porin, OOP family
MIKLLALSLSAAVAVGCASTATKNEAPGPSATATGLVAAPARLTDSQIRADRATLDATQLRLRKLNESGLPMGSYALAKAQCWLDTATTQYQENDRTGYIEEALAESNKIIGALEANKAAAVGMDTPFIARSTKLRPDLWTQLDTLKSQPVGMACYARTVACAEVRLVRAGHAEEQTGWRQASVHVAMVEDALRQAKLEGAKCAPAAVAVPATVPTVAAIPSAIVATAPPTAKASSRETMVVLSDALFRFNKASRADLLPGGLQRLNQVADKLKAYTAIDSLTIIGHTDRLGSAAYNLKLSQQRADTVKAYFESLGMKLGKVSTQGAGAAVPVTRADECKAGLARPALIDCLQPDRRVTLEVVGTAR